MRVAMVNHRDWIEGGMDKVALVELDCLEDLGHHTELFTRYDPKNRETPYRQYFPGIPEYVNQRFSLGKLHRLPQAARNMVYNPQVGEDFGRFLDRFMPDMVHVHGLPRSFSPAIYDAVKMRALPLIQTHHYPKIVCPSGQLLRGETVYCDSMPCMGGNTTCCVLYRCQERSLLRSAVAAVVFRLNRDRYIHQPDLHLVPSAYMETLLLKAGVPAEKLVRHPNFVDTEKCYPSDSPPGEYFLYFGRMAREKGVEALVEAFAPLKHLRLVLAGDGPLSSWVMAQIQTQALDHIQWLGPLDEDRLIPLIQHARATILPSLWGEIFGLSVIESMACGRPVIGSRVGAIPELVDDEVHGMLVSPGSIPDLRDAVLRMARQPDAVTDAMGLAGLDRVRRHYTLRHHMRQLLDIYESFCGVPV